MLIFNDFISQIQKKQNKVDNNSLRSLLTNCNYLTLLCIFALAESLQSVFMDREKIWEIIEIIFTILFSIGILVFVIAGFYTIIETMITDYPIFTIALSSLIVGLILFFCIRRLAWGIRKTWVCKHARNAFIDLCGCLPERKIKNLSKDHRSILLSYRKSRWRKLEDVCLKSSNQEKQQENLFDFFSKSGNDSTHWEITRSIMEIQNAKDICGWIRNAHSNFSM